jgi:hypothetical protein
MHFDQLPTDEQLLTNIGSSDYTGSFLVTVEKPGGLLTVRPRPIPVRAVMAWMVLLAAVFTAMLFFLDESDSYFGDTVKWVIVCLMWFAILPALGALLTFINRHMTGRGDYLRADARQGTLELPANDVTLTRQQIAAVVSVRRHINVDSEWESVAYTNILAHDGNGGYDYYPVLREPQSIWGRKLAADHLAAFLRLPLRQVKRGWRESRHLDG